MFIHKKIILTAILMSIFITALALLGNFYILDRVSSDIASIDQSALIKQLLLLFSFICFIALFLFSAFYAATKSWMITPYKDLLKQLHNIKEQEHNSGTIESNADDFSDFIEALNQIFAYHKKQSHQLIQESKKSLKSKERAIALAEDAREINAKLQQEIDQRKEVSTVLEETQLLLDNIIDSMPSAILAIDNSGYILQANQVTEQWLETPVEYLIGKSIFHKFKEISQLQSHIEKAVENSTSQSIERTSLSIANKEILTTVMIFPLLGHQTGSEGLVVRIDDITQKHQLEEMAAQSDKMKSVGGLAAGMAHEINNPLGVILQNIQNLQRRLDLTHPANETALSQSNLSIEQAQNYLELRNINQFLQHIQAAGERASTIVHNMLQFSRDNKHTKQKADLKQLIDRTLTIADNDYQLKQVQIEKNIDDNIEQVECVINEIEQVLLNLLQNAAHALSSSQNKPSSWHPKIELSCQLQSNQLVITIKDNGSGMSKEVADRIFEPFYTTKTIGQGSGLGLSVSYFIITVHHNGHLEVSSTEDVGSTFTITLPI